MEGMQHITWIPFDIATRYMVDVFTGLGVPHDDALICADVLITADKFGIDSHGVNRLKPIYYDRIKQDVKQIVIDEMERIKNDPELQHLVKGDE